MVCTKSESESDEGEERGCNEKVLEGMLEQLFTML